MGTAKVAVSLPPELLARIDALAAATGRSRSELVRHSLEQTLSVVEEEHTVAAARSIYAEVEQGAAQLRLHEAFLTAARETLPVFDVSATADERTGTGP